MTPRLPIDIILVRHGQSEGNKANKWRRIQRCRHTNEELLKEIMRYSRHING